MRARIRGSETINFGISVCVWLNIQAIRVTVFVFNPKKYGEHSKPPFNTGGILSPD